MKTNYSEYTVKLSQEPSYYGSELTEEEAERITRNIASMIEREFPGINIEIHNASGGRSSKTTGPDEATIDEINRWIEDNWTAAL